jgi:hypothetical protein
MTAVLYPIARNAEAALSRPVGRAARAGEAQALAHTAVKFAQEMVGPAFATRDEALAAFKGRIEEEGSGGLAPEDRFCLLREVVDAPPPPPGKASLPLRPVYRDGRRWPTPRARPATVWRLSISYWRIAPEAAAEPPLAGEPSAALRELLDRPMRPLKAQQPLDIGLFEFRPPDAPHILIPDE